MKINSYFKNEKLAKIIMSVLLFLIIMLVAGIFVVKAEDNKTIEFTDMGWPKILDDDKWTTQMLFDTVQACYQGTIRWVVVSHPSLLGQIPTLAAQRQMMEHCFCVMDKIRKENKVGEYRKKVTDPEWGGNLFMLKAMECVNEYHTLPSFFTKIIETPSDNETITIPKGETNKPTVVPDEETEDSTEESPDQQQEESNGIPETIFQG